MVIATGIVAGTTALASTDDYYFEDTDPCQTTDYDPGDYTTGGGSALRDAYVKLRAWDSGGTYLGAKSDYGDPTAEVRAFSVTSDAKTTHRVYNTVGDYDEKLDACYSMIR